MASGRLDVMKPAPVSAKPPLRGPVGVLGTGIAVPERVVTNEELARTLDTTDEWIVSRTGIEQRRFLEIGRSTSDICVEAAERALARSGLRAEDIDAIILSTITPDQPLPSTALIVKERLGAHNALSIDLNQAACAGGVYAMLLGAHLLQSRTTRAVLTIGAEALSRLTDPQDRTTRVFFGDAAGAAVLGPTEAGYGVLAWDSGSLLSDSVQVPAGGSQLPHDHFTLAAGQQYLKMDGRVVWREATAALPLTIQRAAEAAGVDVADIRHFFLHQANRNIIVEVMRALDVPLERAGITVDRLGNTGAATVYTVLDEAMQARRVRRDDLLVVAGIGAGFLWGSIVLRQQ
ncbi:3-oxoacyl-ACP synthase III family protein [Salinispora pacifica]|uniref:3-oxoacyl-ACP synthase III family protein n=1 Tax=Salinispora pacifica TaxID=351187 RepID=UPI00037FC43B|nr:beta-ketoacyl-ACP synthase 3 [Salinispora pacifica]